MEWRSVVGTVKPGSRLYLRFDNGGGGDRYNYNDLVRKNRVTT